MAADCDVSAEVSNYRLLRRIGKGSDGDVYIGVHKQTGEEVAIKLGKETCRDVIFEAKVYLALQGGDGIPTVRGYGVDDSGRREFMVLDLVGPDLDEVFNRCGKSFDLKTILMLAEQLITCLEYVHSKGLLHRSVKPANFVMGVGKRKNQVHIIDFCKARRYCDRATGTHIPYRENYNARSAISFTSINSHLGIEKTRRDDLESVGYMLMYFLRGSLPWQTGNSERIVTCKMNTSIDSLCSGFPEEFSTYLKYVRSLRFEEQPGYAFFRQLFQDLFKREGYERDGKFGQQFHSCKILDRQI